MTENYLNFTKAISNNDALQKELKKIVNETVNEDQKKAIVDFANAKGFNLSIEDLSYQVEYLDENELKAVAGGGGCGCSIGGYGSGDGLDCICAIAGAGTVKEHGEAISPSQGLCTCPLAGAGATNRH